MTTLKGGLKCFDLNSLISEFTLLSKKVQLIDAGNLAVLNFPITYYKVSLLPESYRSLAPIILDASS